MHPIQELLKKRSQGIPVGIYSCCSANEFVLRAAILRAKMTDSPVLIECTANQVDQFGGYTGMKPKEFLDYVQDIAVQEGLPLDRVILGGDHLGPLKWVNLPESEAMEHARELVRQYILAGFTKIHLDTSMRVADDPTDERLSDDVIARRSAELCMVCEKAFEERLHKIPEAVKPVYIVGSEVPIPGGEQEAENDISVTRPEEFYSTVQIFKSKYMEYGLSDAWNRVIGVVVQLGVEFGDDNVFAYNRQKARKLTDKLKEYPGMVFEGHSTDYQTPICLKEMVEDGIAILKVGPALTFALREALIALESIEKELLSGRGVWMSDFRKILDTSMRIEPSDWKKYYHGNDLDQSLARIFSYSDRARYYLPQTDVQKSIERLLKNLSGIYIPYTLLSQYMPLQYLKVRQGKLSSDAQSLLLDRIGNCIDDYLYAAL